MAGVRRGAVAVLRSYVPLLVIAMVVQIFLAGEGIFGITKGRQLDALNAILALLGWLARRLWSGREETAVPASVAVR